MKKSLQILVMALLFSAAVRSQTLYYPPTGNAAWDTLSPQSLGWCIDKADTLYNYLRQTNTRAFILLKDGRIVLEKYFGTFTKDSFWYWASAGKTLTAFTVGKAQEDGLLDINDSTTKYLKAGWTSATTAQESAIKIRHQLTMTTGLDDGVAMSNCTLPPCLQYLAVPGTRWAYHNGPYTLLQRVLDSATGAFIPFFNQKLRNPIGMNGVWIYQNTYDHVYFSTPRSAARFGLLMLGKGVWNGVPILNDTAYFNAMVNTSQNLNLSYGYLWWLNGKASYRLPQTQFQFSGPAVPHAPADMYAAIGKNGQLINVVPSKGLVLVRMGDAPGAGEVSTQYNDTVWMKLNAILCNATAVLNPAPDPAQLTVFPNPAKSALHVTLPGVDARGLSLRLYDGTGRIVRTEFAKYVLNVAGLPPGIYRLQVAWKSGAATRAIQVE